MLISRDVQLTYTNPVQKQSIIFRPLNPFHLITCEEEVKNNIFSEPQIGSDGEMYIGNRLSPRYFTLTGELRGLGTRDELRRQLLRVVSPFSFAVLAYFDSGKGVTREIDVIPEGVPNISFTGTSVRFAISLTALNPFWRDKEKKEVLAFLYKRMRFPLAIPKRFIFGYREKSLESFFRNDGDAYAGFRALFYAQNGSVTNPSLIDKNSGAFIAVGSAAKPFTMNRGDALEVVSHTDKQSINYYPAGQNEPVDGFLFMDDESDFFTLPPGDNAIGYNAEENVTNLEVIVYYTPQYLGV